MLTYSCFCKPKLLVLLNKYLQVGLLAYVANICLTFKKQSDCLPKWLYSILYHFASPPAMFESSSYSTSLPGLVLLVILILVIQIGVLWH